MVIGLLPLATAVFGVLRGGERDHLIILSAGGEDDEGDNRSQYESDSKRRADETESLRAGLFIGAVCNRGLRGGDVCAGESVNDA